MESNNDGIKNGSRPTAGVHKEVHTINILEINTFIHKCVINIYVMWV